VLHRVSLLGWHDLSPLPPWLAGRRLRWLESDAREEDGGRALGGNPFGDGGAWDGVRRQRCGSELSFHRQLSADRLRLLERSWRSDEHECAIRATEG
jgi:hypothetical protein